MTQNTRLRILYVICDYVATLVALLLFIVIRFIYEPVAHSVGSPAVILATPMGRLELVLYPLVMLFVYWLTGYYSEVIVKSRIQEFLQTLRSTLVGVAVFFLVAMINDIEPDRLLTYKLLLILAGILFGCTYVTRLLLTTFVRCRVREGRIGRRTLIIGKGPKADEMYSRLRLASKVMGLNVVGFVSDDDSDKISTPDNLPVFTTSHAIELIRRHDIQTVVVISDNEITPTLDTINRFLPTECDVLVDPGFFQEVSAPVRTQNVIGEPLVDVSHPAISGSTANIKRCFDIVVSAVALLLLWPVMLVIAIMVRCDSPGPSIYRQVRIGIHKKPFTIYKFRSMYVNAETDGPSLSSESDPRITPLGHKLRKYRLDELPQFWNILRGDMSLVGPRPEREYFIKRIIERAPSYTLVQQVRPGLTSWGMVKFGYASSVDEMIERLRYELIYIDNMSLMLDLRILIYTFKIVITGKGI